MSIFLVDSKKISSDLSELYSLSISTSFPWYFQGSGSSGHETISENNYWGHGFYVHNFLLREHDLYDENDNQPIAGIPNSPFAEQFLNVFKQFAFENGLQVNNIFRAALNHTVYSADVEDGSNFHIDHRFPHKVFLMPLTNWTSGETVVKDEAGNLHYSYHKKFHGTVFDGKYEHRQLFCNKGERRIMFLVTFD